ncbi:MAG: AAA family ATPase [Polaromonas sp.]|nr:AAA family ATPase [Polaromonas sp.]
MPITEVIPADLRLTIDPAALGFADTSELLTQTLPWIGQQRAQIAARFGLEMGQRDYNLFVLGEVGSGRSTLLRDLAQTLAASRPVPPDWCYLHNFDTPERPLALRLPAGQGRVLRQRMTQLTKTLQAEIPKLLRGQDFRTESERLEKAYKAEEAPAYAELDAFAEARSFSLFREEGHLVFTLRDAKGKALTETEALALPKERRTQIDEAEQALRAEIARFLDKTRALERVMNEGLAALRRQVVKPMVAHALQKIREELKQQAGDLVRLGCYLDEVLHDVLENVELFQVGDTEEDLRLEALDSVLSRYRINLVVDNHGLAGAPVLVEDNPLFRTLFGSIEHQSDEDVLVTDFSYIRAGSLLQANGGFLMLHLRDLLADELVWEKLRRFLRSGRLQIEEPGTMYSPIAAVSLTPEAVDVDVKIILIASVEEYYAVQEGDPEFSRRFRCKVDFAESFSATGETWRASALFVAHTCRKMGFAHFSAAAVACLLEDSHREVDDQARQSAIFAHTEALVMESASVCRTRGATRVEQQDVEAALRARKYRHDYPEQREQETIADGERLLVLSGDKVGQLNGLTVIDLGDYRFGFPVGVTARTYAGDEGLLNVEREVKLSGPIHDKGVLILHSYLSALFSHIAPLALNAAVVFEQEYHGVEGDSASCAELYALLSSLSGMALRQGIAVTAAVNQHGEMMPVGAINEKIEGYFRSCEIVGLDGHQGVLIPHRNRRHLMLDRKVVQAVSQGRFHIYTAARASDGLELLTGRSFGALDAAGVYPPDSLLGQAQKTLQDYRRACQLSGPHKPGRKPGQPR